MKKLYAIFILAISVASQTYSQDPKQKKYAVSVLPQYAFIGGARIDGDFRIKETNHYLIVSPKGYSNRNDNLWGFNFEVMKGFGIMASHRYFVSGGTPYPEGVYVQYGATYNYMYIQSVGDGWINTDFGGSDAITTGEVTLHDKVHKFGSDFILGFQFEFYDNLFMDFYTGFGYRTSIISLNESGNQSINGGFLSPAYTGFMLVGGVRIGVCF